MPVAHEEKQLIIPGMEESLGCALDPSVHM